MKARMLMMIRLRSSARCSKSVMASGDGLGGRAEESLRRTRVTMTMGLASVPARRVEVELALNGERPDGAHRRHGGEERAARVTRGGRSDGVPAGRYVRRRGLAVGR